MLLPYLEPNRIEAGCDEAGRGCLAGSVFAAAVILPPDFKNDDLNDSKQLSEKKRYLLRPVIEREAIAWAVGIVTPEEIDKINILKASFLAMHRAIDQLTVKPEHLLIDGNRFTPYPDIAHTTVVKGDGKYLSIAAALFWPKLIVTTIWTNWLKNTPITIGLKTRAILLKPTVKLSALSASLPITVKHLLYSLNN